MATAAAIGRGDERRIIGLISTGHFMSHFYLMTLPPLFPFLREAFGVNYTQLGALIASIYATTAVAQIPVGFIVDRIGARAVLTIGLIITALGYGLIGVAPVYWVVLLLGVCAAVGDAVFHPCDYAILNASISGQRMGRAFSTHNFCGQMGTACAPLVMVFLATLFDWRIAMILAGLFGLLVVAALSTQWGSLQDDSLRSSDRQGADQPAESGLKQGMALLFSPAMLVFFLFFVMISMTQNGIQSFSTVAMVSLHGTATAVASAALSAYLFSLGAGVLIGGELADRFGRHNLMAALVFVLSGSLALVLALANLDEIALFAAMLLMGLGQGIIRPARDMMLRAAAPKGSTGKVFGYVSAGIAAGGALAPIPFGYLLDQGQPQWIFFLIAIMMGVALLTVTLQARLGRKP